MLRRSKRFFISQHPTFGSYKQPVKYKVEQSPYFWWWKALTKSQCYLNLCSKRSVQTDSKTDKNMHKIYNDFGDVRYKGNEHKAFCDWWNTKVNEFEIRGVYLFAEPLMQNTVAVIDDEETAKQAVSDQSSLLVRIPKNIRRKDIDSRLNTIFDKEMDFEKGIQTRNPNRSNAKYKLSKVIKDIDFLKTAFAVYEMFEDAQAKGEKLENFKVAKALSIKVESKIEDEVKDIAYERRVISVAVTRKKKTANDAIGNTSKGIFP